MSLKYITIQAQTLCKQHFTKMPDTVKKDKDIVTLVLVLCGCQMYKWNMSIVK